MTDAERTMPETLWIVGQTRSGEYPHVAWDFQGAFSTRALAEAACRSPAYWVYPVRLDESLPDEPVPMDSNRAYFPLAGEAPGGRD